MPSYDYFCDQNGRTVEVNHPMDAELKTWGEICYAAQLPLGDTEFNTPVRKLIRAPYITIPISNSKLKEIGFTKLVKRDHGVYENVTALDKESHHMLAGDPTTMPHLSKKIGD